MIKYPSLIAWVQGGTNDSGSQSVGYISVLFLSLPSGLIYPCLIPQKSGGWITNPVSICNTHRQICFISLNKPTFVMLSGTNCKSAKSLWASSCPCFSSVHSLLLLSVLLFSVLNCLRDGQTKLLSLSLISWCSSDPRLGSRPATPSELCSYETFHHLTFCVEALLMNNTLFDLDLLTPDKEYWNWCSIDDSSKMLNLKNVPAPKPLVITLK